MQLSAPKSSRNAGLFKMSSVNLSDLRRGDRVSRLVELAHVARSPQNTAIQQIPPKHGPDVG